MSERQATLTVLEVAELLGVHPNAIRKWWRKGEFPAPMKLGRSVRWRYETVDGWMRQKEVENQARYPTAAAQATA